MTACCQAIRPAREFFFSSRRRHTRCGRDWSSDVCSSDLGWWRFVKVGGGHIGTESNLHQPPPTSTILHKVLAHSTVTLFRSEERRVGKECRSRWSPYH